MKGQGVEKDEKKAIDLWEYASKQDDAKAQRNLGYRYLTGKDVPKDINKGLQLLKSASEKNDVIALRRLGECYKDGVGVDFDIIMAISFFTKACLLEDKKSILKLIEIFEQKEYKNMFGDEQFDVFVKAVRLGIPEISKITTSWSNKEPGGFNDGDVVYGSNGLRIVTT